MAKGKSIVLGLVIGGAVSAAATLLTTPSSGREMRQQIKTQSVELKNTIEKLIEDGLRLKDQIEKTSKEGVALINELTSDMKTSVEEWKNAIEPHQENIYEYLEQIEASIKDLEDKMQTPKSE